MAPTSNQLEGETMLDERTTAALLRRRCIPIFGDVTSDMQVNTFKALIGMNEENHKPITLLIDSCGGDLDAAHHICGLMEVLESPVHGQVVGDAHSAAFILLQHCDTRQALRTADLLFHAPALRSGRTDGPRFHAQVKWHIERHGAEMRFLRDRSGQSLRDLNRWARENRHWDAHEALKHGLIDKIIRPKKKLV